MRRREFVGLVGGAAAWPAVARAQRGRMRQMGVLLSAPQSDLDANRALTALRDELHNLGWVEGQNIQIEYRWASGDLERMRTFARELVALQPDVMFAVPTPAVDALLKETRTIPIVFANISDPIGSGFAASLARPGSNVTGFSNFEATLGGKWLEMLKEIAPNATRVAVVFNPKTAVDSGRFFLRPIEAAASRIMNELIALPFDNAVDVKHAITQFSVVPNGAMLLLPDASNSRHRILITDLAAQYHLPAIYPERRFAIGGGLVSYGVNAVDLYRRSATYVDRILKGAKPEDLPIQQPTTFELVINLKTANALGLTVPPMLLARADEVIE